MSDDRQRGGEAGVTGWIWIEGPQRNRPNQYVEFRLETALPGAPARATLRISVDTDFAAWVNGQYAGCGQFTDFPEQRTWSQIDVAPLLQAGGNVVAILVHYCGVDHFSYLPGDAGMWCELEVDGRIIARSDERTRCRPSPCYRADNTARIDPQRGFTFHYDASGEDGWRDPGYRCGPAWSAAAALALKSAPVPRPVKTLEVGAAIPAAITAQGLVRRPEADPQRTVAELMQRDYLSARRSWELFDGFAPISSPAPLPVRLSASSLDGADGFYVLLDLGREECGFPELELDSDGPCVIDMAIGEHLDDLRVRSSIGGRNFACRYVARPGPQRFVHYLDRYAGRYVQLHITEIRGSVELRSAGLVRVQYPVSFAGEFECSDSLCNRIWQTSRRTLHLCMFEHYEDCPWREQGLYANDSRNQMLCGYYAFGDYSFARASLDLLARSTGPDGYQELCAPMKCPITIPSFTMSWFLAMDDYLMYSGDIEFIRQSLPRMREMMGQYLGTLRDGLLPSPTGERYWHMYDWAPGLDGTVDEDCTKFHVLKTVRFDAPLNFYCILALGALANMARWAGEQDYAGSCLERARELRSATHSAFWDPDREAYRTYLNRGPRPHLAELTQSLAILAGVGDDAIRRSMRGRLMSGEHGWVATTLSQSMYKFEALLLDHACGPFVRDRIGEEWSKMLFAGATSFWETMNGGWDFNHAGSLCHGWSGIPVYFYGAYGLGAKPLAPGFSRVSIKPVFGWGRVSGAVPTPHGRLAITLDRQRDAYTPQLQVPPSVEAIVE